MPVQKGKSSLMGKLGAKLIKAHEAHKDDETEFSKFGDLPPGIRGGVAQLVECKFGQYEKGDLQGEFFFYAAGAVLSPKEIGGMRIEGLRTSIIEPLCDTPGKKRATIEDHHAHILNELRKLGVDTREVEPDDLEATAAALKESQPVFRFSTSQGKPSKEYPDPRTFENWDGVIEDYTPEDGGDAGSGVDDETEEVEAAPKKPVAKAPTPNGKPTSKAPAPSGKKSKPAEPEEEAEAFDEFGDLDSLTKRARKGDKKAQGSLTEMAIEKGWSADEVEEAEDWNAVMKMITEGKEEVEDEEEEEPQEDDNEDSEEEEIEETEEEEDASPSEWVPKKDEIYLFKPIDPKTKKPAKKAVECEVLSTDPKKKTVTLKNLDTGAKYEKVGWDDLSGE